MLASEARVLLVLLLLLPPLLSALAPGLGAPTVGGSSSAARSSTAALETERGHIICALVRACAAGSKNVCRAAQGELLGVRFSFLLLFPNMLCVTFFTIEHWASSTNVLKI
jgi:hypothetical protein